MGRVKQYQWAVIGAGPAGIAAVGKLIDFGVNAKEIVWIDPEFKVGDFGTKWLNVSSNTKVNLFQKFLEECQAFDYSACRKSFTLSDLDPQKTCMLKYAAEPLQWVTECLKEKVVPVVGRVENLNLDNGCWLVNLLQGKLYAKNVVMAQGSEPKLLQRYARTDIIPLERALDKESLENAVNVEDIVAVFGASHSAMIAVRLLLEAGVKQVVNFYTSPLRYAVYHEDWILFDNTGLKGETALWARKNIDGRLPENLLRIFSNAENITQYLPICTKTVHAVGFSRRRISVDGLEKLDYNAKSGIIAPGLFGLGIAFPEETVDPLGNVEASVGLWKFMHFLQRVIPVWLKHGIES